jgi:anaerobic selenocysteine-containing dehydrogenase
MAAIGSPMIFTSLTIDQPGKFIAKALHGDWAAGPYPARELDALLIVGANPLISLVGFGIAQAHDLKAAQDRGMKLAVIDPRRTETAGLADLFLQPRPGEDVAIMAGLIRVVLAEGLEDADFLRDNAHGLEALRLAVAPFTPDLVEERAGIPRADLVALTRMYAGARRAAVTVGTGPNMASRGTLVEYLGRSLMTICGHWPRAGERTGHPGLFFAFPPAVAGTAGPYPASGFGERLRVGGFTDTVAGLPTIALADEILTPGDGQVRALLVVGGNPMAAIPNQAKTKRAFDSLDLLVSLDVEMSATARCSDYVIAAKLPFETAGYAVAMEGLGSMQVTSGFGLETPYAQVADPIVDAPADSDVHEEWEFFIDLAAAMGHSLALHPIRPGGHGASVITPDERPDASGIWGALLANSAVPLAEIRETSRTGRIFDLPPPVVAPKPVDMVGRLDLGEATMMAELGEEARAPAPGRSGRDFQLTVRRMRHVHNSAWMRRSFDRAKQAYNPAFLHPDDMRQLGLSDGDGITITSSLDRITGVAVADSTLRRGCVSISHNWGGVPGDAGEDEYGASVNRLIDDSQSLDSVSGLPIMSALPVDIEAVTINETALTGGQT